MFHIIEQPLDKYKNKKIVLAYSGGVDSLILAILLNRVAKVKCIFIKTPYIANYQLRNAISYAKKFNLDLDVIYINELIKNDNLRCYNCKKMFFSKLLEIKDKINYDLVVDGTHYDDLFEDRPGLKALEELNIKSPFAEFKVRKREILELAKELKINIPKETCLLTRFYRDVSLEEIKRVEKLEEFLRKYLKGAIKLRDLKDKAILEVEDIEGVIKNREIILKELKKHYSKVLLNLERY
ncbi:ATP-dependent sacrificial sulfur transferase LarE [Methanocaldococcus sp.]